MSRIGTKPIKIPSGVSVTIDGTQVTVKGPKGTMSNSIHPDMQVYIEDNVVKVERPSDVKKHSCLLYTSRCV